MSTCGVTCVCVEWHVYEWSDMSTCGVTCLRVEWHVYVWTVVLVNWHYYDSTKHIGLVQSHHYYLIEM